MVMIEPLTATTTGDRAVPGRRAGVLSPPPGSVIK